MSHEQRSVFPPSLFSFLFCICARQALTPHSQAMIDEFDMDGDGEISQEEFIAIMLDGE